MRLPQLARLLYAVPSVYNGRTRRNRARTPPLLRAAMRRGNHHATCISPHTCAMSAPPLRFLPRVDVLADLLPPEFSHAERVRAARAALDDLRRAYEDVPFGGIRPEPIVAEAREAACKYLQRWTRPFPARVLNATGIIVHTGLGRSRLSHAAIEAVIRAATDPSALEIEVESGARGRRDASIAALLREITGCEDATVVNNGAGATVLSLAALCAEGEVACSRGELVEIGGGFRMPDVMLQSGCVLREVGTTNKTRPEDYRQVLAGNSNAGGLLKVHPSNFRIEGFTQEASIAELADLARELGLPLVDDLGSGALLDLSLWGLEGEPTVQSHVASGADAVIFSGDKLLGGPQCGIICGRRAAIERIRRHSLARALRCDKMTLAALHATLLAYRDPSDNFARARAEVPTLKALCEDEQLVRRRAQKLKRRLSAGSSGDSRWELALRASRAQAGAGSLPTRDLASWSVMISARSPSDSVEEMARAMRRAGVWGRIESGALWLDARTLSEQDADEAARMASAVLNAP